MSNSPVKYRHPENSELEWSGKGRQPKWVEAYLANGGSIGSLVVAVQDRDDMERLEDAIDAAEMCPEDIDLGIGNTDVIGASIPQRMVIDTQDQQLDIALPEVSQQQLEVCLHEFGLIGLTAEEFVRAGMDEMNQATVKMCRAGVAFWAAQEALKNKSGRADLEGNKFSAPGRTKGMDDLIAEIGMPKERVYEAIRLAKFYARLPDDVRNKALTIGKKHALLLASLPQEVIDQAAESGNDLIGKADMMTVAELKAEIKALQRREKNYEAELERSSSQIKRLSEAKQRTTDFLLRTEELREECMALQLGAELHLNSLKKLFVEIDIGAPEGDLQTETLWVTTNTIAARSLDLLEFMRARVPDGMPDRPMTRHCLTPDEAIRWLQDYPLIENRFAAEAGLREARRDMVRPRGPGRPAGSRNKGDEA